MLRIPPFTARGNSEAPQKGSGNQELSPDWVTAAGVTAYYPAAELEAQDRQAAAWANLRRWLQAEGLAQ